jgi:hypothetical protein
MFKTNDTVTFQQTLKQFVDAKHKEYKGYAYPAGYLEALTVEMFQSLTKKQQKYFQDQMQKAVDKLAV